MAPADIVVTGDEYLAIRPDAYLQHPHTSALQHTTATKSSRGVLVYDQVDIASSGSTPVPVSRVFPVNEHVKSKMLSLYLQKTSKWLESTDSSLHFSSQTGHLTNTSQILAVAAVTLGSTQYMPDTEGFTWLGEQLYKFFIATSLHSTAQEQQREIAVAALIISVYLAASGKIGSCFHSLKHCAELLKQYDMDASFPEFPSTCFWAFVRLGKQMLSPN